MLAPLKLTCKGRCSDSVFSAILDPARTFDAISVSSISRRRFERQYGRDSQRLGQAQKSITNSRQTCHEAGCHNPHGRSAQDFISVDTLDDDATEPGRFSVPPRIAENLPILQKQFNVPKIAVAKRVIQPKAVIERRLQGGIDLAACRKIIKLFERRQTSQPDTRSAGAPSGHKKLAVSIRR